jgi:hypothetical protein
MVFSLGGLCGGWDERRNEAGEFRIFFETNCYLRVRRVQSDMKRAYCDGADSGIERIYRDG